jgi:predicted tellurium resistance membrane protein TerC
MGWSCNFSCFEIVLGIDNLVFIAILAEKLPPEQRDKARIIGFACPLYASGVTGIHCMGGDLTQPLFHIFEHAFSGVI